MYATFHLPRTSVKSITCFSKERIKGVLRNGPVSAGVLRDALGSLVNHFVRRPRNGGTRAYSLLVNAILRGHFGPLHPGHCQDVFSYLKTRWCLFCWCGASYIWSCFFYLYLFAVLLSESRTTTFHNDPRADYTCLSGSAADSESDRDAHAYTAQPST